MIEQLYKNLKDNYCKENLEFLKDYYIKKHDRKCIFIDWLIINKYKPYIIDNKYQCLLCHVFVTGFTELTKYGLLFYNTNEEKIVLNSSLFKNKYDTIQELFNRIYEEIFDLIRYTIQYSDISMLPTCYYRNCCKH